MSTLKTRSCISDFKFAFDQNRNITANQKLAMELFLRKGLPDYSNEEYRFLPITKYLEKFDFNVGVKACRPDTNLFPEDLTPNLITFVNGVFSKDHSSIIEEEVQIGFVEASAPIDNADPFDLLNLSLAKEEVQISISEGKKVKNPVLIKYVYDNSKTCLYNPRWSCYIGKNSHVCLLELGQNQSEPFFINKKTNINVGEGAELEYIIIQSNSQQSVSVNNNNINLSSLAQANLFTFTFDGQLVRNNLNMNINGEGVSANLSGVYLVSKNTIADNHTVVDHKKPNSNSHELYHGVMDERSVGIFNGKVLVRQHAQKTNAFQANKNILVSNTANIHAKPQLEIWADDVKCSHGCTTGKIDDDALFYLCSRGISTESAMALILFAFSNQVVLNIKNDCIRNYVESLIQNKLSKDNVYRNTMLKKNND